MNIALTYNQKPDSDNSATEAPSSDESLPPLASGNYNDTYAEWDSIETIEAVRAALAENHNVEMIEANEEAFDKLRRSRPAIVFNIAEGMNGLSREAQMPAMLDMLKIPYTGSDPLTLAICLDKSRAKEILTYYNIKTARFATSDKINMNGGMNLNFPLFVKPVGEGSSKGIFNSSVVKNKKELAEIIKHNNANYSQPSLIEEFLPGREFTVAVMGNGSEAEALPIIEIIYDGLPKEMNKIYSYEAKWILDRPENPLDIFQCPAKVDAVLERKIKETALAAYNILKCRDWSRIDVRLDAEGEPNIIEVNPLPGILPDPKDNSCFPKAARTAGLNYSRMLNKVLDIAIKRYGLA